MGLGTILLVALLLAGRQAGAHLPRFAAWIESLGWPGAAVFVVGYALATVAFVPGSLLTLAAGAVFGLFEGTLLVLTGATLGAALAFLLARHGLRGWVERRLADSQRFAAIDRAIGAEGRKIAFLLRLSPVFPFNLLNYALGLTRIRFSDYLLACVGMLPGTFLYVYLGKGLGSLAAVAGGVPSERGIAGWLLLAFGLVATALATVLVTRAARRALKEIADA